MNHDAIRAGVDQLWSDLEAHHGPSITEGDLKTLRALDDAAIDGTLTEARFERTRARLTAPRLFGDYELLIDEVFKDHPEIEDIKLRVAEADAASDAQWSFKGFASLRHYVSKNKAPIPSKVDHVWRVCEGEWRDCENDRKAREEKVNKLIKAWPKIRNISERNGRYTVQKMDDGIRHKATYGTLKEAVEDLVDRLP